MLSFPSYNSSTIPMFHLPLCFPSPFVNTTSPVAISICLWLFFILCLSLRERRYSLFHLLQAASLQRLIYRCHFLITLSSSSNCSSGIVIGCPCIRMFGVSTGNLISSAVDFLSLSLCPVWLLLSLALWVLLSQLLYINIALPSPTILSNCPPDHGALVRLNFHFTCFVIKNSCNPSSL